MTDAMRRLDAQRQELISKRRVVAKAKDLALEAYRDAHDRNAPASELMPLAKAVKDRRDELDEITEELDEVRLALDAEIQSELVA